MQICSLLQVLACTRNRSAAGGSKRDSPTDALLAAAMKALEEMVGLAARCGALETLMAELPLPAPGTGQQAEVSAELVHTVEVLLNAVPVEWAWAVAVLLE